MAKTPKRDLFKQERETRDARNAYFQRAVADIDYKDMELRIMSLYASKLEEQGIEVTPEALLKAVKEQPLYTHDEVIIDENTVVRALEIDKKK